MTRNPELKFRDKLADNVHGLGTTDGEPWTSKTWTGVLRLEAMEVVEAQRGEEGEAGAWR